MKFYLCNAFSINMLNRAGQDISFVPVTKQAVANLLKNEDWESAIGHANTAAVLSSELGFSVTANRINVSLTHETSLIVAQMTGPRLPEGATSLPNDVTIEYWQVYHAPKMLDDGMYMISNGVPQKIDRFAYGYEGMTPAVDSAVIDNHGSADLIWRGHAHHGTVLSKLPLRCPHCTSVLNPGDVAYLERRNRCPYCATNPVS